MTSGLPFALARAYWLFAAVTPCCAARRSGRFCSAFNCRSSQIALQRAVVECSGDIVVGGNGFVAEQLPQIRQRLDSRQLSLRQISLELQQLQVDLQIIILADGAFLVAHLAEVHGL